MVIFVFWLNIYKKKSYLINKRLTITEILYTKNHVGIIGIRGVIRKYGEKVERNKMWRKIKNRFNISKLILYVYLNLFYLFISIV